MSSPNPPRHQNTRSFSTATRLSLRRRRRHARSMGHQLACSASYALHNDPYFGADAYHGSRPPIPTRRHTRAESSRTSPRRTSNDSRPCLDDVAANDANDANDANELGDCAIRATRQPPTPCAPPMSRAAAESPLKRLEEDERVDVAQLRRDRCPLGLHPENRPSPPRTPRCPLDEKDARQDAERDDAGTHTTCHRSSRSPPSASVSDAIAMRTSVALRASCRNKP